MKVLFAVIVFMAGAYLLMPEGTYQKLSSLMPQNKMDNAAKKILSQVDARLESFEQSSIKVQNKSTTQLLATLATLEKTVHAQQLAIDDLTHANKQLSEQQKNNTSSFEKSKVVVSVDEFESEPLLAKTQFLNGDSMGAIEKGAGVSKQAIDKREQSIKRQALLQDIVDRMNATSLVALTNN